METKIVLAEEREAALATERSAIVAEAAIYAIVRDDSVRDLALAFGQRVKRMRGMVAELFDDPISQAHKTHKMLCGRRKMLDDPLDQAETTVKRGIGNYEAEKRAAIERQRQAEIAEARRVAEEAERLRQQQITAMRKTEEDKRLAEATALEAAGRKAEAEAALNRPVVIVPPPRVDAAPTLTKAYVPPEGASTRTNWKFDIVDESLIPRTFLTPDLTKIGAHVRANKEVSSIPGVLAFAEQTASLR